MIKPCWWVKVGWEGGQRSHHVSLSPVVVSCLGSPQQQQAEFAVLLIKQLKSKEPRQRLGFWQCSVPVRKCLRSLTDTKVICLLSTWFGQPVTPAWKLTLAWGWFGGLVWGLLRGSIAWWEVPTGTSLLLSKGGVKKELGLHKSLSVHGPADRCHTKFLSLALPLKGSTTS